MSVFIRRFLFNPGNEVLLEIESVNILDLEPPASITGIGTGTVLIVGEFENGPFNEVTEVTSATEMVSLFGAMGYTYDSVPGNNPCARKRTADNGAVEYWNGNGAVQLSGKKFRRLIIQRVDTSVGAVQFTRLAWLAGAAQFRYDLEPGQLFTYEDGSGPITVTFNATAAQLVSGAGVYPTLFTGVEWVTLGYDDQPDFTVYFLATDQTDAQVAARINQFAGFTFVSAAAGVLTFTAKKRGKASYVRVVASSAPGVLVTLGIAVGTTQGTGNVDDIDNVTAAEVDDATNAASSGDVRVQVDSNGALRLVNVEDGGTGTLRVIALTALALDFPVQVSSTANSNKAVLISSAGVYPTLFAGGETVTLGYDDASNVVVTFQVGDQTQADVITRINAAFAAAGYTLASSFTATRLQLESKADGGQIRVVGASAAGVLTTLGLAVSTVNGQSNPAGFIPAGTRVRVPSGQQFVTMQDVDVSSDSAGSYSVKVRHALDDGSGLSALAGTVTEVQFAPDLGCFACTNAQPMTAALTEAAIDAAYLAALDATLDLNTVAKIVNIVYSARQSNAVRAKLKENVLTASATGHFGRMACVRPPLGTLKAVAKNSNANPGVGATRDQRVIYCYPGVATLVPTIATRGLAGGTGFTADGLVDVGSDGFMASILSQLPPEENPGQETPFTTGAVSLERSANVQGWTMADYTAFKAAGIAAVRFDSGTMIFQSGVTSVDPLVKPSLVNIARRRMADFIQDTLAIRAKGFGKKLSTLARRNALASEIDTFLLGLVSPTNPALQRIHSYSIDKKSGNTTDTLGKGMYFIIINVRTLASLDSIVLQTTVGENVDTGIQEVALSLNPV